MEHIAAIKCDILGQIWRAHNMADCYILLNKLSNRLKPSLDECVDAHIMSVNEATHHLQSVFSVLHDKCREIYRSPSFNN